MAWKYLFPIAVFHFFVLYLTSLLSALRRSERCRSIVISGSEAVYRRTSQTDRKSLYRNTSIYICLKRFSHLDWVFQTSQNQLNRNIYILSNTSVQMNKFIWVLSFPGPPGVSLKKNHNFTFFHVNFSIIYKR